MSFFVKSPLLKAICNQSRALIGLPDRSCTAKPSAGCTMPANRKGTAAVNNISQILASLTADRRGVTALEYAMLAALIVTSAVSILTSLGDHLSSVLSNVSSAL